MVLELVSMRGRTHLGLAFVVVDNGNTFESTRSANYCFITAGCFHIPSESIRHLGGVGQGLSGLQEASGDFWSELEKPSVLVAPEDRRTPFREFASSAGGRMDNKRSHNRNIHCPHTPCNCEVR